MHEMVKVRCHMNTGFKMSFGRLPGCPTVPAAHGEVEMHPMALKYLRQDPRVVFDAPPKTTAAPEPKPTPPPAASGNSEDKPRKRGRPRKRVE